MRWRAGDNEVAWTRDGVEIRKTFAAPPDQVIAWPDPPSVIVVETLRGPHSRIDNAVVFNTDGTERTRLRPPRLSREPRWDIGFYTVHPDPYGLVAVFATQAGDFWGRPDLNTGELNDIAPWR